MKKLINNLTLGADPEVFLTLNGDVVSAEGIIGGTKDNPRKIDNAEDFYILEDNIMIEFNIPISRTKDEFRNNINFAKNYIETYIKLLNGDHGISFAPSAVLDKKYLNTKQAKEFGCDPDFNVYTKEQNPKACSKTNLRSCGGHIHIGYDEPTVEKSEKIIYALDICLGLDSLILDNDKRRRELYGKAGSFRFKDYGVEYRTLSNFWISHDININWVFDRITEAVKLVNEGIIDDIVKEYGERVRDCIDNGKEYDAMALYEEIQIFIHETKKVNI